MEKSSENTMVKIMPYAFVVWGLAALFYAYEFFLRLSPNVMVSDLIRDFGVTSASIGFFASLYYYPYAILQIPGGMILDKYGIRHTLTFSAAIVTLGCFLFASTHYFAVAGVGRMLMGLGSAFAFVGCLKLSSNWFPARYFGLIVGLTNTLGVTIGALGGFEPLSILVNHIGWRATIFIAMAVGILLTILIGLILRDRPKHLQSSYVNTKETNPPQLWKGFVTIIRSPQSWLIALYGGLMVTPVISFGELWSGSFLSAHHLDKDTAAGLSSFLFIGIAVGGPLHGFISGWLGKRRPVMFAGVLGAFVALCLLIYGPFQSPFALGTLLFIMGFFTVTMLLCFAMNSERHDTQITGVVIGFTNMVVMLLGSIIFLPLIGKILDLQWHGNVVNAVPVYTLEQYQTALSVLPICQLLAFVAILFIRETRCEHV